MKKIFFIFSESLLNRLPILQVGSTGDELFSVSAALQYIAPISQENVISANRWLEWDATQLQVPNYILI